MTKKELIAQIFSENPSIMKKDIEQIFNSTFEIIARELACGSYVQIQDFGTFQVRNCASKIGRNAVTGDQIPIPERKMPVFRPGKGLKDVVSE